MSKKRKGERLYDGLYRRAPQSSCGTVTIVFAAAMVAIAIMIALGFMYYGDAFKPSLSRADRPQPRRRVL
jgi:hypothetical protein